MLLSNDKFITMKENKYSYPSLKMLQTLLFNIERIKIHTFIIQQIPFLSPEILVSFI